MTLQPANAWDRKLSEESEMAITLEIYDTDSSGALVSLRNILRQLEPECTTLQWTILDLEAIGKPPLEVPMEEFEHRIRDAPGGWMLTYPEFLDLAKNLDQVINGTFVGDSPSRLPRLRSLTDRQLERDSEMMIEVVDSSVVIVGARDDRVIHRLQGTFTRTQPVPPIQTS